MDDIRFYLEQVQRQNRANEFAASIQQPGHELATMTINAQDIAALALAIQTCTPEQLARWIHYLISYDPADFDDYRADRFTNENDWRADDTSDQ